MTAKRKKSAAKKSGISRVPKSKAVRRSTVRLVLITNPRSRAEFGVTTLIPERRGDDFVIEVFGVAVGGPLEAVRAIVLDRDQPIPRIPPDEGSVVGHIYPSHTKGDGPVETMWRFERGNRRVKDNRLIVRPGLNNRLLILAKFSDSEKWCYADQIVEFFAGLRGFAPPPVQRKFTVIDPINNKSISSGDLNESMLNVKVEIDSTVGSKLLIGVRAKIIPSNSTASPAWTTASPLSPTKDYTIMVPGAMSGRNTLVVEGEFDGYSGDWVSTPSIVFKVT